VSGTDPGPDPRFYLRNPYLEWRASEGIPIVEGFGVDCMSLELGPWPRLGGLGAYVDVAGRGDYLGTYVVEIPAGGHLERERHLFEELIFVLRGRGTTTIELADGSEHIIEWQAGSLFAIPLNAGHRHANASGREPARFAAVTTMPIMLNVFHDVDFVFNNPYEFRSRVAEPRYLRGEGVYRPIEPGRNQWETALVPNLYDFDLPAFEARGAGSKHLHFILADSTMHAHMAEIPAGRYKKAHRHGGGTNVFCVTGQGYSLLWLEGQTIDQAIRFEWKPGTVYAVPAEYFHQHFNLAPQPSRYLALGFGSIRYPTLEIKRRSFRGLDRGVSEGGTQIQFEDQDPAIHRLFEEEVSRVGGAIDMPVPVPRAAG
jgi:oxalate decarboxylase/phosphoglucose isomerase-like protein (cupin superfamily)